MKRLSESVGAWARGMVWTAMVLGCGWAGAQSYMVSPAGHYKVVSMSAAAAQGEAAGAQSGETKDELFNGTEVFAKNATHVTEITMDPDSLGLVGGPDEHKAHSMVLNVVRTYEYDKPGMYNVADVDAFRNKLNSGDWHCSVHERDLKTGESTDVCSKRRTDGLHEQAIVTVEPRELTFIHRIWRGNGPGRSDLGFFPMLPGVHGLPLIAMTNPEALAGMPFGVGGVPFVVEPDMHVMMRGFNTPEMRMKLDELNKRLKEMKPIDPKQMEKLNEQMKQLKPLNEEQMKAMQEQLKAAEKQMKAAEKQMEEQRRAVPQEVPPAAAAPAGPDAARPK